MNAATVYRVAGFCLSLSLAGALQAMEPPPALYRAELDRCLESLRGDLVDTQTTRLRHTVLGIAKQGAWYQFDIESEVFYADQPTAVRALKTRCRANSRSGVARIS